MKGWRIVVWRTVTTKPQDTMFGFVPAGEECAIRGLLAPDEPDPPLVIEDEFHTGCVEIVPFPGEYATRREAEMARILWEMERLTPESRIRAELSAKRTAIEQPRNAASRKRDGGAHARVFAAFDEAGLPEPEFCAAFGIEEKGATPERGDLRQRNGEFYRVDSLQKILRKRRT